MSVRLKLSEGMPFLSVTLVANSLKLTLPNVLLDTGSAATIFKRSELAKLQVLYEFGDVVRTMAGAGSTERVVAKQVDSIMVGELQAAPFTIYMSPMDYHFEINGILGLDFLMQTGAQINLKSLTLRKE